MTHTHGILGSDFRAMALDNEIKSERIEMLERQIDLIEKETRKNNLTVFGLSHSRGVET